VSPRIRNILMAGTGLLAATAVAGEARFRWTAHPVVIPPGHAARLTLDLHVPAGVDEIEYDVDVMGPDGEHFVVGEPEQARGRWQRAAWGQARAGLLPIHLPMTAPEARAGLHQVVLHARVRTCTGSACAEGKEAKVPVVVHVLDPE